MLEWFSRDPRKFFSPLFDYAISERFFHKEDSLDSLGFKVLFANSLKQGKFKLSGDFVIVGGKKVPAKVAEALGLNADTDKFPIGLYEALSKPGRKIVVEYGSDTEKLCRALQINSKKEGFASLVRKTEAGLVPVVHSHLLFNGCPHPLIDSLAFSKISKLGGFKPLPEDRSLAEFEIRFQDVFSSWSSFLMEVRKVANVMESKLEHEDGAREIYAMASLLGVELDLPTALMRIGHVLELPSRPNLNVYVIS